MSNEVNLLANVSATTKVFPSGEIAIPLGKVILSEAIFTVPSGFTNKI